jgi:hypothetical protein
MRVLVSTLSMIVQLIGHRLPQDILTLIDRLHSPCSTSEHLLPIWSGQEFLQCVTRHSS